MKYSNMVKRSSTTDHPFKQPFPIRPCCVTRYLPASLLEIHALRAENRTNDRARKFVKYLSLIIEPMAFGLVHGVTTTGRLKSPRCYFSFAGSTNAEMYESRSMTRNRKRSGSVPFPSESLGERNGETIGETFRNADKL